MADLTYVGVGANPNDGNGDALRRAFQILNADLALINAALAQTIAGTMQDYDGQVRSIVAAVLLRLPTAELGNTELTVGSTTDTLVNLLAGQITTATLSAIFTGVTPAGIPVRRDQFIRALEASGAGRVDTLLSLISPNESDPTRQAYYADRVPSGGILATLVASTFSLNSTQMAALFTAARAIQL